ncbi:membrane-associated phospholipid phosphatase [Flavobacterium sp. 28YEA47A]|uniref:phosphatase PAP2 family protein n=1 Tax=Flavobacterium sp. 28YEA47A TaxID=3156276 RepID=UPI00351517B5
MDINVINNFSRLKATLFLLPLFLLAAIALLLYSQNSLCVEGYIQFQKNSFFFINHHLGQYPNLQYNLTQLGDALVFLSFLSIFIVYAPKVWEALLSGSLVSLVFCGFLKKIFAIPRPPVAFDNESFIIVGKRLSGCNSLPSGHSITIFTIFTVLLFAFMPKKLINKILWCFAIIITGLLFAFSRVGVGAHYPLDVIIGCILGFMFGLAGIFISRKYKIWAWIGNKKYCPIFMLLFLACSISLVCRIINENLTIFYLAFVSLAVTLYKIITVYVKNKK